MASLIIPAHNEGSRIASLLAQLPSELEPTDEVYVVANGCTDDTVTVAHTFSYVTVVELNEASKIAALNRGDQAAGDNFPRLYLDADIAFTPGSIRALLRELDVEEVRVVAPRVRIDTRRSSFLVRSHYWVLARHPWKVKYASTHLAGHRIYGCNRAARSRFGEFPRVTNDDSFFDQCYSATERRIVETALVLTDARLTTAEEVGRLVRVHRGNRELDQWFADSDIVRPDRHDPLPPSGSRVVRIARMLATSGFVTRPSLLAPFYIAGWWWLNRLVTKQLTRQESQGSSITWNGRA